MNGEIHRRLQFQVWFVYLLEPLEARLLSCFLYQPLPLYLLCPPTTPLMPPLLAPAYIYQSHHERPRFEPIIIRDGCFPAIHWMGFCKAPLIWSTGEKISTGEKRDVLGWVSTSPRTLRFLKGWGNDPFTYQPTNLPTSQVDPPMNIAEHISSHKSSLSLLPKRLQITLGTTCFDRACLPTAMLQIWSQFNAMLLLLQLRAPCRRQQSNVQMFPGCLGWLVGWLFSWLVPWLVGALVGMYPENRDVDR